MSKYELSLEKNYVSDWTLQDALREFIQNGIDQSKTVEGNDFSVTYEEKEGTLYLQNKKSVLEKRSLLLGSSTKTDDANTIGKFGEGYKIALLVLTRLNKKVTIFNYGAREIWNTRFVKARKYNNAEILTVFTDKNFVWEKTPNNDLTIKIEGIEKDDYKELIERTLFLQDLNEKTVYQCEKGQILLDPKFKGCVFVNGLFINTIEDLKYGYDIKPNYIEIGRDRNLVNSYKIQFVTSHMWSEYNHTKMFKELLEANAKDVEYITYSYKDYDKKMEIATQMYEVIKEEYLPESVEEEKCIAVVSNQKEYEKVVSTYENVKPIMVNETMKELIKNSNEYQASEEKFIKKNITPQDKCKDEFSKWLDKYSYQLSIEAEEELKEIIDEILTIK